jgi:hypothetical protein
VPEPTAIPVPVPAPERYTYTGKSKSSKPRRLVIKYSVQRARPFYGDDETVGERLARTARERAWLTAHAPTALDAWAQDYGAVLELQRRVAYARF